MTKNKLASWFACLWLIVSLNPFFIWNRFENYIVLISTVTVILATVFIGISHYGIKRWGFLLLLMTMFLIWMLFDKTPLYVLRKLIIWLPFYLIILWPINNIRDTYYLFKKIILFFAIGSTVVSVLGAAGLLGFFPSFVVEGRSALHQRIDMYYRIYGCFVTLGGSDSLIPRACGFLQEPGHFSIVLGFVYVIDSILNHKRNLWIIICGLLTFSLNFVIMALAAEFLQITNIRKSFRFVFRMLLIVVVLGVVYTFLPDALQKSASYLFFERNISDVYDLFEETGSLTEALNARTNQLGELEYYSLTHHELIVGRRHFDSEMILSDYRGVIYSIGYIGLALSILTILSIVFKTKSWRSGLALSVAFALVYLHRSWMFVAPYLYCLSFLGVTLTRDNAVNKENTGEIVIENDAN